MIGTIKLRIWVTFSHTLQTNGLEDVYLFSDKKRISILRPILSIIMCFKESYRFGKGRRNFSIKQLFSKIGLNVH